MQEVLYYVQQTSELVIGNNIISDVEVSHRLNHFNLQIYTTKKTWIVLSKNWTTLDGRAAKLS